ncbi:hypothetical protein [Geodermatophilus sp. CPCC 205761]|uniref:hypothetical protein n=1 Tax=Geodermatophilus sp. CPCC 205761 TaxID=2936597 RepID=UPI003EEFB224
MGRAGEVTAEDLAETATALIDAFRALNAVAAVADPQPGPAGDGPLAGAPFAVEELLAGPGAATTGCWTPGSRRSPRDGGPDGGRRAAAGLLARPPPGRRRPARPGRGHRRRGLPRGVRAAPRRARRASLDTPPAPVQREILELVFDNTRRVLAHILRTACDREHARALVDAFWSYQLPGLDGLPAALRR